VIGWSHRRRCRDCVLRRMLVGKCLCWCVGKLLTLDMSGLRSPGVVGDVGLCFGLVCLSIWCP
jgi:hypothetical protein